MTDSERKPTKAEKLNELNVRCAQLVNEVNELIDEDYDLQESQRLLTHFTSMNGRFDKQVKLLNDQITKLREDYVALISKFSQNHDKARVMAGGLYLELRNRYAKKLRATGEPIPNVCDWEIPHPFADPKGVQPKVSGERSKISSGLSRKVFKLKNHYRTRTHRSESRAKAQIEQLEKVLAEQKKMQPARQRAKSRVDHNITIVQDRIEQLRLDLEEPNHAVWHDVYLTYAKLVLDLFVQMDENMSDRGFGAGEPTEAVSVPYKVSVRRMSGPDINDAPELLSHPQVLKKSQSTRDLAQEGTFPPPQSEGSFKRRLKAALQQQAQRASLVPRSAEYKALARQMGYVQPAIPMQNVESYHLSQDKAYKPLLSQQAIDQLRGGSGISSFERISSSCYGDRDGGGLVSTGEMFGEAPAKASSPQPHNLRTAKTFSDLRMFEKASAFDENHAAYLYTSQPPVRLPSPSDLQGTPNTPVEDYANLEAQYFNEGKTTVSPLRVRRISENRTVQCRIPSAEFGQFDTPIPPRSCADTR